MAKDNRFLLLLAGLGAFLLWKQRKAIAMLPEILLKEPYPEPPIVEEPEIEPPITPPIEPEVEAPPTPPAPGEPTAEELAEEARRLAEEEARKKAFEEAMRKAEEGVKFYGAKGDGKADDTNAFKNAIADTPNGKALLVPSGSYKLTDTLDLPSDIKIIGIGKPKLIQSIGKKILTASNQSNIHVDGLSFEGLGAKNEYEGNEDIIRLDDCSNITISDNYITEIRGAYGICLSNCSNVIIEKNTIYRFSYAGIALLGHCTDIEVGENKISESLVTTAYGHGNSYGIMHGSETGRGPFGERITYKNNVISNIKSWEGLDFHGGVDLKAIGNTVIECRTGIMAGLTYLDASCEIRNVIIENNKFECTMEDVNPEVANSGIYIGGRPERYGENFVVKGNTVKYGGIAIQGGKYGNYGGIFAEMISGLTIENNTLIGNYIPIVTENTSGFTMSNNAETLTEIPTPPTVESPPTELPPVESILSTTVNSLEKLATFFNTNTTMLALLKIQWLWHKVAEEPSRTFAQEIVIQEYSSWELYPRRTYQWYINYYQSAANWIKTYHPEVL